MVIIRTAQTTLQEDLLYSRWEWDHLVVCLEVFFGGSIHLSAR